MRQLTLSKIILAVSAITAAGLLIGIRPSGAQTVFKLSIPEREKVVKRTVLREVIRPIFSTKTIFDFISKIVFVPQICPQNCPQKKDVKVCEVTDADADGYFKVKYEIGGKFAPSDITARAFTADPEGAERDFTLAKGVNGAGELSLNLFSFGSPPALQVKINGYGKAFSDCGIVHAFSTKVGARQIVGRTPEEPGATAASGPDILSCDFGPGPFIDLCVHDSGDTGVDCIIDFGTAYNDLGGKELWDVQICTGTGCTDWAYVYQNVDDADIFTIDADEDGNNLSAGTEYRVRVRAVAPTAGVGLVTGKSNWVVATPDPITADSCGFII